MKRANEDIISQLHRALLHQTQVSEFWREQAMLLLERDVDVAIYGEARREFLQAKNMEVRDLGSE